MCELTNVFIHRNKFLKVYNHFHRIHYNKNILPTYFVTTTINDINAPHPNTLSLFFTNSTPLVVLVVLLSTIILSYVFGIELSDNFKNIALQETDDFVSNVLLLAIKHNTSE